MNVVLWVNDNSKLLKKLKKVLNQKEIKYEEGSFNIIVSKDYVVSGICIMDSSFSYSDIFKLVDSSFTKKELDNELHISLKNK